MLRALAAALAVLTMLVVSTAGAEAAPAQVQGGDAIVSSGGSVEATLDAPATAGNLIVAYAVWDNAAPASISDSRGNVYASAGVGRTPWAGNGYSAQLFYASNVAGGPTTVRASFGTATSSFGILYVHEYSGLDRTDPLDAARAAEGVSTAMDSGAVTTRNPSDLLVGAGASVGAVTQGGLGFAVRSTAYGNVVEDRIVGSPGSYRATATHTGGGWVMQVAAFKAADPAGDTTPPSTPTGLTATASSESRIDLTWTPATDDVGVTGYDVYRDGRRIGTTSAASFHDSGLSPGTTYTYTVSAHDAAGNASPRSASASATTLRPPVAGCELPRYPSPSCTGVPDGTSFTKIVEGAYTASTPGEVIDGWHIKGSLIVAADDVVVRNSEIGGSVANFAPNDGYYRFTIADSTVGPRTCGEPTWMPNAIGFANYTAIRVHARNHVDGFRASGPDVTVRDSYYKACVNGPDDHADGIQDYPSAQNLVLEHNTLDMSHLSDGYTAPIFVASAQTVDARIVDNLVLGGTYSVELRPANGTWIVRGNRVADGTWDFAPYETFGLCAGVETWSDNTVVTVNANYNVTSTVRTEPCPA